MHRILFFGVAVAMLLSCDSSNLTTNSSPEDVTSLPFRPHILWIVAEDLSPILPMYGDSTVETPYLSRLAAEGIVFDQFFSPSGVCAPSRAAIATGMYPSRIGASNMRTLGPPQYMPEGLPSYECLPPVGTKMHAEYLRQLGYYTTNNAKEDYQFRPSLLAWDESSNKAHWRNREPGQPFFAIFNLGVTHESQVWARARDSLWVSDDLAVPIPPYLPSTEKSKRDVRQVYSNIKTMDAQVGEILAQLEEDGLLDSTIIFWYGDHGGPLPRQKRLMYDSGIKVPMVVRFPDKWGAGTRENRMTSFLDLLPTLLSLAGEKPPASIDGKAFYGSFTDDSDREMVFAASDRFDETYDMRRAARTKDFKYIKNFYPERPMYTPVAYREKMPIMQELLRLREEGGLTAEQALWFRETKPAEELYDLNADPYELHNLAEIPEYMDTLQQLRKACLDWMVEIGDVGSIPEEEYVLSIWPDKQQPTTAPPIIEAREDNIRVVSGKDEGSLGYILLKEDESVQWISTKVWYGFRQRYMRITPSDSLEIVWNIMPEYLSLSSGQRTAIVEHRLGFRPSEIVYSDALE